MASVEDHVGFLDISQFKKKHLGIVISLEELNIYLPDLCMTYSKKMPHKIPMCELCINSEDSTRLKNVQHQSRKRTCKVDRKAVLGFCSNEENRSKI